MKTIFKILISILISPLMILLLIAAIIIAIHENNQNKDGSISIPRPLKKYMNNVDKI